MKLIDILVQKLPECGGWPKEAFYCVYHSHREGATFFDIGWKKIKNGAVFIDMKIPGVSRDDVSRKQYEAALAASKTEWDGEGIPPAGLNAEVLFMNDDSPKWYSFVASYIGKENVIAMVGLEEFPYKVSELSSPAVKFRPIRSEADKRRDEAVKAFDEAQSKLFDQELTFSQYLYDAIAAGKIPHIRID